MHAVTQILQSHVASGLTLGVSVFLERAGQVQLQLCEGQADIGVPLTPDAIFLWLSSGKPLTAIAIAMLFEQHLLRLEDPVVRYLPAFASSGKQEITLAHLLTHTAGLHKSLPSIWGQVSWGDAITRICQATLPAGFIPGQSAAYDPGASWLILGEVIQKITGQTFATFMRDQILLPCDMPVAAFSYSPEQKRLVGYFNTSSGQKHPLPWNAWPATANPWPGASFRAPIAEIVHFYHALQAGRLITPETLRLFCSPQRGLLRDLTFGLPLQWGYGLMPYNGPEVPYTFGRHASAEAFGHGGQQSSLVFCDPRQLLIFAAAYNGLCGERAHHQRMLQLLDAVFT